MADTKKTDTESDDTKRSDQKTADEAKVLDDSDMGGEASILDDVDKNDPAEDAISIEDAEIIEEISSETAATDIADSPEKEAVETEDPDVSDVTGFEDPVDVSEEDISDLETLDGVEAADVDAAASAELDDEEPADTEVEPAVEPEPDETPEPAKNDLGIFSDADAGSDPIRTLEKETVVVEKRGAIVPGFLGGALAAVGMIFAAPYVLPGKFLPVNPSTQATLTEQAATIASLQSEIQSLTGTVAETAKTADLATLKTDTGAAVNDVKAAINEVQSSAASKSDLESATARIADAETRVADLEKRPIAESPDPASIAAVKAYGDEMADLRKSVEAQMAHADELVKSAIEASDSKMADAEASAKAAEAQALRASRSQALVDIQAALENGSAFDTVLPALDGVQVPDALVAVSADGVATLPEVRDGFTLAARKALTASRKATAEDTVSGRFSSFVQNQLGVRSLSPTEGDDPDAVLSRAEAAVAETRLADAITELSALPDDGQQIMADWVAQANARANALAAADELAASLATN